MGVMRSACWAGVAFLCTLAAAAPAAAADDVLVLGRDGQVHAREDRALPTTDLKAPPRGRAVATMTQKKKRTVYSELKRLRSSGAITPDEYSQRRAAYVEVRRRARRLDGVGKSEMRAVIATVESMAARRRLSASRLNAIWLTLDRNIQWWSTGRSLGSGQRIEFEGSELVWQYYPGQGLQLQMLGNFGKLNGLWSSRQNARLAFMLDELLPLAARRAGGVAWEYYFSFGGGRPPWVSGLAEGAAVQALARAARRLHREAEVLPIAKRALGVFKRRTPTGVRVPEKRGDHYALYSFAPSLRVLNGFVYSLVGLYDYARISGDPDGTELFQAAEPELRREVPLYDTGAWSLYARGSVTRESSLSYHDLLRDFLGDLCRRTDTAVYCETAERFDVYKRIAPTIDVRPRRLRGGRYGRVRFELSKISTVTLQISRGARTVEARPFGAVGYGKRSFGWQVPRRAGRYTVVLTARDLAGNTASDTATVRVLKPRKKKRT